MGEAVVFLLWNKNGFESNQKLRELNSRMEEHHLEHLEIQAGKYTAACDAIYSLMQHFDPYSKYYQELIPTQNLLKRRLNATLERIEVIKRSMKIYT
jgi:hypothetical protein